MPHPNNQSILKNVLTSCNVVDRNRNRRLLIEPLETHKAQSTPADVYDVHNNSGDVVRYDVGPRSLAGTSESLASIDGAYLRFASRVVVTNMEVPRLARTGLRTQYPVLQSLFRLSANGPNSRIRHKGGNCSLSGRRCCSRSRRPMPTDANSLISIVSHPILRMILNEGGNQVIT